MSTETTYMKYIITESDEPIIFHSHFEHSTIVGKLGLEENIKSAGFCRLAGSRVYCYGEAMGVSSNPQRDSVILKFMLEDGRL